MSLKRIVIKEELVAITGNYVDAIILNQFLYWSDRTRDFDNMLNEEKIIAEKDGIKLNVEPKCGWVYKKSEELSEETMLGMSVSGIRKRIKQLVENELLFERNNPKFKWDKTKQYRVNYKKIKNLMEEKGYVLQGYKFSENTSQTAELPNCTFENSKCSNNSLRISQSEIGSSQSEMQYQRLLPEITTTNNRAREEKNDFKCAETKPEIIHEETKIKEPELEYKTIVKEASEIIDAHRGTIFATTEQYEATRYVIDLLDNGYKREDFMNVVKYALSNWVGKFKENITPQLLFRPDKFKYYLDIYADIQSKQKRMKSQAGRNPKNNGKLLEEEEALSKATNQEEYIEIWESFHKEELEEHDKIMKNKEGRFKNG